MLSKSITKDWSPDHRQLFDDEKVKQGLRLLFIVLLLIMAAFGIGIGNVFHNRERYLDNEIEIEATEKKEDEEDDDVKQE